MDRWPACSLKKKRVTGYYGVAQDITERKQAEEALRLSDESFRLVAKATNDALSVLDIQAATVWSSESYERFFQLSEPPSTELSWYTDRIHRDDRPRLEDGYQALFASKRDLCFSKQKTGYEIQV